MITKEKLETVLTPENFLEWISQKEGTYDYCDATNCAVTQYLKDKFPEAKEVIGGPWYATVDTVEMQIPDVIENSVHYSQEEDSPFGTPWEFVEAAERLRESMEEMA